MPLQVIRLELARTAEFPEGSAQHGYEFTAPLGADGHIDADVWRDNRKACVVRRFWGDEDDEQGHLVHTRARAWAFRYDIEGDPDDEESGYKFDSHAFVEGEYVSIREHDGELRTFRVVSVHPRGVARG